MIKSKIIYPNGKFEYFNSCELTALTDFYKNVESMFYKFIYPDGEIEYTNSFDLPEYNRLNKLNNNKVKVDLVVVDENGINKFA